MNKSPIDGARIAAYRCPCCGGGVMSAVNIAGLTTASERGSRFRLRCANPECPSVIEKMNVGMDVEAVSKDKIRFTYPCIACGGIHTAEVNSDLLATRDIFTLQCPNYGIDICFTGELKSVKFELSRSELELLDMMSEGDKADISLAPDTSKAVPDPEISERIIGAVHCLDEEGLVFCHCGDAKRAERKLEITLDPENVIVRCPQCGSKRIIPAVSRIAADDFIMSDSLTLN